MNQSENKTIKNGRYTFHVQFENKMDGLMVIKTIPFEQYCKTLKEAFEWVEFVKDDKTVKKMYIVDNVSGKIIY